MAVAMGVSSMREPPELLGSPVPKKRAWGADAQQLMQLMMNQLQQSPSETSELTLDLLGNADPAASSPSSQHQLSPEFLHLDTLPLPSGWEKCLDLQTGELYFVNKSLGVSSVTDPRKRQRTRSRDFYNPNCRQPVEIELQTAAVLQQQQQQEESPQVAHPHVAHEFLASKKSETESLNLKGGQGAAATGTVATPTGCSTSSSSGSPPLRRRNHGSRIRNTALPSSSFKQRQRQQQQQQHWSLQQHRTNYTSTTTTSSRGAVTAVEDSKVELDLNLSAGGGMRRRSSSPRTSPQTVCTVEMVQNALRRSSEKTLAVKREAVVVPGRLGSSSFSSLTNSTTRSEPSAASPATSNSSSASSRSGAGLKTPASAGVSEAQSIKVETVMEPGALVMGACTRCLMYVMLNKADPRCPRCDCKVPVDFATPCNKQKGGLKLGLGSN